MHPRNHSEYDKTARAGTHRVLSPLSVLAVRVAEGRAGGAASVPSRGALFCRRRAAQRKAGPVLKSHKRICAVQVVCRGEEGQRGEATRSAMCVWSGEGAVVRAAAQQLFVCRAPWRDVAPVMALAVSLFVRRCQLPIGAV